jgi:hypothetical protein
MQHERADLETPRTRDNDRIRSSRRLRFIDAFLIVVEILVEEEAASVRFGSSNAQPSSRFRIPGDAPPRRHSTLNTGSPRSSHRVNRETCAARRFDATIEELPMCASRQTRSHHRRLPSGTSLETSARHSIAWSPCRPWLADVRLEFRVDDKIRGFRGCSTSTIRAS